MEFKNSDLPTVWVWPANSRSRSFLNSSLELVIANSMLEFWFFPTEKVFVSNFRISHVGKSLHLEFRRKVLSFHNWPSLWWKGNWFLLHFFRYIQESMWVLICVAWEKLFKRRTCFQNSLRFINCNCTVVSDRPDDWRWPFLPAHHAVCVNFLQFVFSTELPASVQRNVVRRLVCSF